MHNPQEPIMSKRNKIYKTGETPTNNTSNQGMQKSTKISNVQTSFTHFVMKIMPDIYLKDSKLHQQFIYSMLPS